MCSPTRTATSHPAGVKSAWERIKAEEKAERAAQRPPEETAHKSLLSSVKAGQPALTRAMELQRKASTVGFDWNDPRAVLSKIREEADEIEAALDNGDADELAEETGDLLFALVNLARHVGADPESALRGTNAKFERRFAYIEARAGRQRPLTRRRNAGGDGRAVERGERSKAASSRNVSPGDTARAELISRHVRHGIEPRHHDVALGLVDAHRHVEAAVVKLFVEHFGIAMQPADAGAVGSIDGEIERRTRRRQPILDRGQQCVDPLAGLR